MRFASVHFAIGSAFFWFDLDHFVKDFAFLRFALAHFAIDSALFWYVQVYLSIDSSSLWLALFHFAINSVFHFEVDFALVYFVMDLTYLYYVEKPFFIRQWVTKLVFTEKKSNNTWLTYIISLLLFFKISSTALILLILAISFDSFQNYLMKMIIQQINTIKNEVVFWYWYFLQRFTKFFNNTICFATQHNFYVITLCVYWLVSVLGCNELWMDVSLDKFHLECIRQVLYHM